MSGAVAVHPIYVDFLEALREPQPWRRERYRKWYYLPNRALLDSYHRNWSGARPEWVEEHLEELYPDPAMQQLRALYPVDRFPKRAADLLAACSRLMPTPVEPDVYLMVGVYTSNAFETVLRGRPAMGICLEQHNPGPAPKPQALDIPPEDVPIWFAHEYAHCVRFSGQSASLIRRTVGDGDFIKAELFGRVPMAEWLVAEGVAVAFSEAMAGGRPLARHLGYSPAQLAYCLDHEPQLWERLRPDLWKTDEQTYLRWFEGFADFVEPGLPGRCGYFLGYRMVSRAHKRLDVGWADLATVPCESLLPFAQLPGGPKGRHPTP